MLLSHAAFLSALGFVGIILGELFGYPEISVIGAVLIVGVGGQIGLGGLETQTGVTVTNETANTTVKEFNYSQAQVPNQLPLSLLIMLLGGVFVLRSLNKFS